MENSGMRDPSSNSIPKTLSESIYNSLRTGIINNELKAGQRIYEKEIAKQYGVSTTPVREAFLRLSAEGYLSIDSHRKASVRKISYKELEDIFRVMGDLDALAMSQAVDHIPVGACAVAYDQRGWFRPSGEGCDIGAYERAFKYYQPIIFKE